MTIKEKIIEELNLWSEEELKDALEHNSIEIYISNNEIHITELFE